MASVSKMKCVFWKAKLSPGLITTLLAYLQTFASYTQHIGLSHVEKIFKKTELLVSMGRLTCNLVNPARIKWEKRKKSYELDEIWTQVKPSLVQNEPHLLNELTKNLNFL